jgi:hypothetical protein
VEEETQGRRQADERALGHRHTARSDRDEARHRQSRGVSRGHSGCESPGGMLDRIRLAAGSMPARFRSPEAFRVGAAAASRRATHGASTSNSSI